MDINTTARYKVKCNGKYSYNTPDFFNDNDWHTEKVKWQKTVEGGELLEFIASKLNDRYLYEFHIENNTIYLGYFDPTSGECGDYTYTISLAPLKNRG